MNKQTIVGIIGLGNMGRAMASTLNRTGYKLLGLDPSPIAQQAATKDGIDLATNLGELASLTRIIVLSLPNSIIVHSLLQGRAGLIACARPDTLIIDTSTGDPQLSREIAAELALHGLHYVDAPVSGGPRGAASGQLTMFIGGDPNDVRTAEPILTALSSQRFYIGEPSTGQVAKLVNNLLVASHLLTASEAFRMAEAAGVSTEQLIPAINAGTGRSGVTLYNYPHRILNKAFDSGFTMGLMRKDMGLVTTLIHQLGIALPITAQVGAIWRDSVEQLEDAADFNRIVTMQTN